MPYSVSNSSLFYTLYSGKSVAFLFIFLFTVRPRKTETWNKGMSWTSSGVYDCNQTFIVKYDYYAFEWYIAKIPPVMHHWAALFSNLNVKINLFHSKAQR